MRNVVALGGILGLTALLSGGVTACGGAPSGVPRATVAPQVAQSACMRVQPGVGPKRVDDVRDGSTVALASLDGRTLAYVADEDDNVVHTIDLDRQIELSTTALDGSPSQILVAKDGRVIALLRDKGGVQVLEPTGKSDGSLTSRCVVETSDEPVAIAATPDDRSFVVTSGWGHTLASLGADDLRARFTVDLPREPRAVTISDDGTKAFVSHVVGSKMSVVDLTAQVVRSIDVSGKNEAAPVKATVTKEGNKGNDPLTQSRSKSPPPMDLDMMQELDTRPRVGCQGFALAKLASDGKTGGRILGPQVLVDPGEAAVRSQGYGSTIADTEMGSIAVIDPSSEKPLASSVSFSVGQRFSRGRERGAKCLLPRAAATSTATKSVFVACLGIDMLVEYDGTAANPHAAELHQWPVGGGPTGVAIDAAHGRVAVWSQFDRVLNIVPTPKGTIEEQMLAGADKAVVRVPLSRKAEHASKGDLALGRKLFHAAGDPRLSRDGRACASCHPDGRDDALTWATPEGPRQTPMLAGRLAKTAPFGWNGDGKDVTAHLASTFQRLGGGGLSGRELEGLMAYIGTMRTPHAARETAAREAEVKRGAAIFASQQAACATCHVPGSFTDGKVHDIGSGTTADGTHAGFDTPSLRFIGGTGPYFHDGRFASLRELLVKSDGMMGHTAHLSTADLGALEAYLRTL